MNEHVWLVLSGDEQCVHRSAMARYKKDGWELKDPQPGAEPKKTSKKTSAVIDARMPSAIETTPKK